MQEYEQLLENVYKNLPEKAKGSGERFEAPKFESFTEGNKTIVKNFSVVCDKLRRSKEMLSKHLSKELAVPVNIEGERLIIQRKLFADALNRKLEEFISKFVICRVCNRPDTNIVEAGHGLKQLVCEACGAKNAIR
jgi:translation initiation factor 2 subunit 2